ncbi:3-phosphoglycerate dehydrogenase [Ensifer sp. ENS05]|uniref:NAD(P)-dependent oxidoreductase n=1 Tax=Ensifer sp. ENS05 TaxID=2769277 RepID=UPI0017865CD0|nr:NAD(P)-dependent oxidoreductase [Ensifer sp. ENS05]MBD9596920.1 3-phosphoglycerate dehydrogenase [Ensifer sp. ENS05]
MPEKIVLLDPFDDSWVATVRQWVPDGMTLVHDPRPGVEQRRALIADADFAIAAQIAVDGDLLRRASRLKLLHKLGTGTDNLDLETARELGIGVARLAGAGARTVAEYALGLMLAAQRAIPYSHARLMDGQWIGPGRLPMPTYMLTGKVVGVVGLGAIGMELAKILKGFDCTILYNKRTPLDREVEVELGVRYAELPELLSKSDVVSLNCPLTAETRGLINRDTLKTMKGSAILVNVARGGVLVEEDLIQALRDGVIGAAALDVFAEEPLPPGSPLIQARLDNLVLTSHLAAVASENFEKNMRRLFSNMLSVAQGGAVPAIDRVL